MALVKTALPKSRAGRTAKPLDTDLVKELADALKSNPFEMVEGDKRPAAYGPETDYDTDGKASAAGRRYANAVEEILKTKIRVNSFSVNGTDKGPFRWRCYISLANQEGKKDK